MCKRDELVQHIEKLHEELITSYTAREERSADDPGYTDAICEQNKIVEKLVDALKELKSLAPTPCAKKPLRVPDSLVAEIEEQMETLYKRLVENVDARDEMVATDAKFLPNAAERDSIVDEMAIMIKRWWHRPIELVICENPFKYELYSTGYEAALRRYAHWKDGVQYVGSTGTTLEQALVEMDHSKEVS